MKPVPVAFQSLELPNAFGSAASLENVESIQLFGEKKSRRGFRGAIITYRDSSCRALGECRIGNEAFETVHRPTGAYLYNQELEIEELELSCLRLSQVVFVSEGDQEPAGYNESNPDWAFHSINQEPLALRWWVKGSEQWITITNFFAL